MTPELSLFLDIIRFFAALAVVLHHACFAKFGTGLSEKFASSGTEPVIIFFVLSGFVIAYTAETKDRSLSQYVISRLARLLSVVVPALALTVALDAIGNALYPAIYADHWNDVHTVANLATSGWLQYATTLTFTNELWWLDLWPGTNSPFWSLGFEVGYYLLFAIGYYFCGHLRIFLFILCAAILGPKILLLGPEWLLGVLTWRFIKHSEISARVGIALLIGAAVGYAAFIESGAKHHADALTANALGPHMLDRLGLAYMSMSNMVSAFLFAAGVVGFTGIQRTFTNVLLKMKLMINNLGGMTFSMYLFHYPLIYFFASAAKSVKANSVLTPVLVFGGTMLSIYLLSRVTEAYKGIWKQGLKRLFYGRDPIPVSIPFNGKIDG